VTHALCVHLNQWPIDRLCRRRPELRHKRVVLIETVKNRQIITHASSEVPHEICAGMVLAEAKARCAELIHLPATPGDDLKGLETLGRWMMRFSPNINVCPPSALFLDATGLEGLFGTLHNLRCRVVEAMTSLRIAAGVTVAPTPGAAWALAVFGQNQSRVVTTRQIPDVLHPLPPAALRLDSVTVGQLHKLGVHTVKSLLQLERDDLATRFGRQILDRIDQATGAKQEVLVFLKHRGAIRARMEFGGVVESLETLQFAVRNLTTHLARQLTALGLGAKEILIAFKTDNSASVQKAVRFTRPSCNPKVIFDLLRCGLEKIKANTGFVAASLLVTASQPIHQEQSPLIGEKEGNSEDVEHLIERLQARFGRTTVWGELVESNLPEKVSRFHDEAIATSPHVRHSRIGVYRPMCLLSEPRAIKVIVMPSDSRDGQPVSFTDAGEVYRLAHVRGPERITGQWWNGRTKARDYFDALDVDGNRYWLFRVVQTGRWFLHGIFE
jgi:protein ImuB